MDDSTIIRRCQAGQIDLFALIITRYQTPVYSFCLKLAKNEADAADLFQDTWLKAMKNLDKFCPGSRLLSWLFSICINLYRDSCRKRARWRKLVFPFSGDGHDEAVCKDPGPDSTLIQDEAGRHLSRLLRQLPDQYRLPVLLHYFQEFSMKEIAEILEIQEGTVKSRLFDARKRLKRQMTEEGYGRE